MKKTYPFLLAVLTAMLSLVATARAQQQPQLGDSLAKLQITAPMREADKQYMGIPAAAAIFTPGQVKADVVIIQAFNMYCSYCQEEAPQVNKVRGLLAQKGLDGRIKILGVGLGNSQMEVDLFRKKFAVEFPLLPDADGSVHHALGKVLTPFFVAVDNRHGGEVIFTHLGAMPSAESFLQSILNKAGMP